MSTEPLFVKLKRFQTTNVPVILIAAVFLTLSGCSSPEPTPVPSPTPTSTPEPTATATPTSMPEPTATATPTSTPEPTATARPDGLIVTEIDFGEPVEGTVFEELLTRFPDDELSREFVQLFDSAGIQAALGVEQPAPGAGTEAWQEFFFGLSDAVGVSVFQLSGVVPLWPSYMRPYMETLDWYPYVAFDFGSVEQRASGDAVFGTQAGRNRTFEVAFGKFDPAATAAALAVCGCDQPDLNEYGGFTYYSWGVEGEQNLANRFDPPLYDSLGRGPRLLVQEGEAFWTITAATMEQYIDMLNRTRPSLAADPDYVAATRWLAAMGTMDNISLVSRSLGIDQVVDSPQLREEILSAPLLKPFSAFASGTGYDGERIFDGLVVVHDDAATAQENVALLLDRMGIIRPRAASQVEIEVEGRFLLLRAYGSLAAASHLVRPGLNRLVVHE